MALPLYASRRCQIIIQGTSHLSRSESARRACDEGPIVGFVAATTGVNSQLSD